MRLLRSSFVFVLSASAVAQTPSDAKTVTFNRADAAHCRVVVVAGKPLLESSYEGISVAVGMPENKGNGEFSVYVVISHVGPGTAHVEPKKFSALFSDGRTRFVFYDKAAEVEARVSPRPSSPGMSAQGNEIDRSMIRGGPTPGGAAGLSPSETLKGDNVPGNAKPGPGGIPDVFLRSAKLKQGTRVAGMVYFRKPKGSRVEVRAKDVPGEIDIPVDGVLFRF